MKGLLFILGLLALAGLFSCQKTNKASKTTTYDYTCYIYGIMNGDTLAKYSVTYTGMATPPQDFADSLMNQVNTTFVTCY